jgi:hypothetical protein
MLEDSVGFGFLEFELHERPCEAAESSFLVTSHAMAGKMTLAQIQQAMQTLLNVTIV